LILEKKIKTSRKKKRFWVIDLSVREMSIGWIIV
jgi:hypothetical protein